MLALILLVTAVALVLIQPVWSYAIDSNELRKFPSPSYAAVSSLWRISQNLKNRHYLSIHEAHKQLGTHVRIAPKHVSVSDPMAMNEIYGHGANFLKDAWYDGGAGEHRHMADTRVKAEHQAKRKKVAHVFAQKTLTNLEPAIATTVETLVGCIDASAKQGQAINMRRYFNYFTIDVFSKILYSNCHDCLQRGSDMVTAETINGKTYSVPFIKSLHDATSINTALGMEAALLPLTRALFAAHPYKKAGADFDNIIYHNTMKRLNDESKNEDIFSKMITTSKGEPNDLPLGELLAECSVMMNAGTDTTTAALTNTCYLLTKHPRVLAKLRAELDAAIPADQIVPSSEHLASLPYLRACIEEALRLRPASSMGLPRVVPKGGRKVAGQWIEEGVTVSVPTYSLLRDSESFVQADEFIPERWTESTPEQKAKMAKAHLPFSVGPRACVGRNIAYFEQLLVAGTLVRLFDFEFAEGEKFELETIERFNSNPGEMPVRLSRRHREA